MTGTARTLGISVNFSYNTRINFNPYHANVENMMSYNASKWQVGFNSVFKRIIY